MIEFIQVPCRHINGKTVSPLTSIRGATGAMLFYPISFRRQNC